MFGLLWVELPLIEITPVSPVLYTWPEMMITSKSRETL